MWLCTGHHPRLAPCGSRQTPAAWRGCIPLNLQEGDVAVCWPSPAARAMRLTSDACGVARLNSNDPARRGCGCVLAITRGLRHAAHIGRLRRGAVEFH